MLLDKFLKTLPPDLFSEFMPVMVLWKRFESTHQVSRVNCHEIGRLRRLIYKFESE